MKDSIEYYNMNADSFIEGSLQADMSSVRARFLAYLPKNASILDLGCGSGRDTKAFLDEGYSVIAADGSKELCKRAAVYTGQRVRCLLFEDLDYEDQFDGVWACASLLHVSKVKTPNILKKVRDALKPKGTLYASYKYGTKEWEKDGRFFHDCIEEDMTVIFSELYGWKIREMWKSEDVRKREGEYWINVIASRED